jgi:hypothetical protein
MQRMLFKILAAIAVMFTLSATPAMAQATRTWISGVGDDVNPCSRTAPCKTWAGAISKTAATGEINCLDSGGFGAVTITKSITLRCIGVEAGILVAATNGITINAAPTDRVTLIGLDLEGLSGIGGSLSGVYVVSAFDVLIQDCNIHGFQGTGHSAGVEVNAGSVSRVTIRNSILHSNNYGILANSAGGFARVKLLDSLILDNLTAGVSVDGAGNNVVFNGTRVYGVNGLEMLNGGTTTSYGGNVLTSGSPPTTTLPTQ